MPFPTLDQATATSDDLVEFYRVLRKDATAPKDLWVHQGEIVRAYAPEHLETVDVALELPPGAGKTVVGGTIGEWRRQHRHERVVYACATKGLAIQTHEKLRSYGMASELLIGRNAEWSQAARLRYTNAQAMAVTTYWSIFNSNPPLQDAELLILDDAHAAEGAVSGPWSITIERVDEAYLPVLEVLEPTLDPLVVARLRADSGGRYANEIYLASVVGVATQAEALASVIERAVSAGSVSADVKYKLRLVQSQLDRMLIYVSRRRILIRPFVPPTATLEAFDGPKQRLYMSATLGEGGELERAFGRRRISRLPVPRGWDKRGNGRRFFVFPGATSDLSKSDETTQRDFVRSVISEFGRAVVLAPDTLTMEDFLTQSVPTDATIFRPDDVEDSLSPFCASPRAVLGMANRYDGLDLADDSCRLIVIAGLPARGDLQERFLAKSLGAVEVLQERIRARVTQGAGRATRNPNDYAVVLILGSELMTFTGRRDVQGALHPELHAEVRFGLRASIENDSTEILSLLDHFLRQSPEWKAAEETIVSARDKIERVSPPGTAELEAAAGAEVMAWQALWQGEWDRACQNARVAVDEISGGRGSQRYAAFWNYLLASWTTIQGTRDAEAAAPEVARAAFKAARAGARGTTWLSHLASQADRTAMTGTVPEMDPLDAACIGQVVRTFDRLRRARPYNDLVDDIKAGLAGQEATHFESALVKLGELAGASEFVGDGGGQAKPDASWNFSGVLWVTWEAKSEARPDTQVSVGSVDQTNRHLRSMQERVGTPIPSGSVSILTTPQGTFHAATPGIAEEHSHWVTIEFVQELATGLDRAWRAIKTSIAPETEDARKAQIVREALMAEDVLPTQWLSKILPINSARAVDDRS